MKILVFGTGKIAIKYLQSSYQFIKKNSYKIIGFLDNDKNKQGSYFYGKYIYNPCDIACLEYDQILICCNKKNQREIYYQLIARLGVTKNRIHNYDWLLKMHMAEKYKNTKDVEIKRVLDYWQENDLSVFNCFIKKRPDVYYEVNYDINANLPYILFETIEGKKRRMYYPSDYKFEQYDGIAVVKNLMYEQYPESPHLYVTENHNIKEGDVVVDAGVCEGNFSLRYVDVAAKIYLFEMDEKWRKPLYYTFDGYQDKVKIYHKAISNRNHGNMICLDEVIRERVDFLKMDIEGGELAGLTGAKKILQQSNAKCSICSYHRYGDETRIKHLLQQTGYQTSVSKGYMVFIYGDDIWKYCDFRRGIVYGKK